MDFAYDELRAYIILVQQADEAACMKAKVNFFLYVSSLYYNNKHLLSNEFQEARANSDATEVVSLCCLFYPCVFV
jgi:hypothetical protein